MDLTANLPEWWGPGVSVTVCLRCWDLRPTVGRSVRSTTTVPLTKHASTENVKIPVLGSVESMPTAGLETTFPSVFVTRDTLVTPSPVAGCHQVRVGDDKLSPS